MGMSDTRDDVDSTHFERENLNNNVSGNRARLAMVGALLLAAGFGLAAAAGPPRLPAELPSAETLLRILTGATFPLDGLVLILVDVAWLGWAWTVLSLLLELFLVVAELVAYGARWVQALRQVADRLSVPLVRRAVTAAFAVQLLGRSVSIAAAQTLPPPEPVVVAALPADAAPAQASLADTEDAQPTYLVRPGDTLWSIAEQAYGSGTEYRRLVDANVGRAMPDGRVFSAQGVIQPGWRLSAPGATWNQDDADNPRWYTVRRGDTLSSIAEQSLGDRARWPELFELNQGLTSPDGLHTLDDPNTIWPGLRLQVSAAAQPDPPPEQDPVDALEAPEDTADDAALELLVASAAPRVAEQSQSETPEATVVPSAAQSATADAPPDPAPTESNALPLLRTPHALQPVVLDEADSAPADPLPAPSPSPQTDAVSPPAHAEVSLPTTPPVTVPVVPLALGGLGLAGAAGLAFGARRLRRLRPLSREPESEVVVQGGFAEAELAHDLTRGLHGVGFDPVGTLVAQVEQFLAEYDLSGAEVASVCHGRSSTSITLRCGLAQQPMLLDVAAAFAEKLDADVEACVSTDQDVIWRLVRLRKTRLLPTADSVRATPCLVPLGVLYDRQTYAAAWAALGHVLIVSLPGHGADTILASLLATLTARRSPAQLQVWMIGSPRALPEPLLQVPHLARVVDPTDTEAMRDTIEQLRQELDRRAAQDLPVADLAIVVPEIDSFGEHAETIALLASRAMDLGVRLLVASANPDAAVSNPLIGCFTTRMVLRMEAEEASVALLGVADAAFLGGGGRLLLRLDGREPVELYGYQVSAEHLERLVKVMRQAYPGTAAPAPKPPPDPPDEPLSPAELSPVPPVDGPEVDHSPHTRLPDPGSGARSDSSAPPDVANAQVQIYCLGTPHVVCAGQVVWPRAGGGDAKPWELLLYLACQPAEGVARGAVIDALWPEAEEMAEDANHRFRQLRYRLRRQLQQVPGGPSSDGICMDRRGLRLDPGLVYSDAQEFLALVRDARIHTRSNRPEAIGRLERARALYAGDLLDGPDARRYAWLDERDASGVTQREHFRRLFQNTCTRLAEAYASVGRTEDAIEVYHDLTDMDPGDERLFQALFRLRAQTGDIEALEAEEQRMRELLREASEDDDATAATAEPDGETMEEYRRLLEALRAKQREPAAV